MNLDTYLRYIKEHSKPQNSFTILIEDTKSKLPDENTIKDTLDEKDTYPL